MDATNKAVPSVDELAQFIRTIDGNHTMGAGALAENIVGWLATHPQPAAVSAPSDEQQLFNAMYAKELGHLVPAWELEAAWRMMVGDMWRAARAAAPVSGQGEVVPEITARVYARESTKEWVLEIEGTIDDTSFTVRHTEPLTTPKADVPGLPSHYIDSRPRSEDSRVKVLEEAAQACENERVADTGCEGDLGYNMAIKHAAAAIRALASTPPKADNE